MVISMHLRRSVTDLDWFVLLTSTSLQEQEYHLKKIDIDRV